MYQNFIIPYLYEAQHVSGDTPPIVRSLKLHWQPLGFHTQKVVGRVAGGRCRVQYVPDNVHQRPPPSTCPYPEPARFSPYPLHSTSWRSILILSSHLHLGLPIGLFPSGFPTKTLHTPLLSPMRAVRTDPSHSENECNPEQSSLNKNCTDIVNEAANFPSLFCQNEC